MWFYESVFYQIYPLGYAGAERENDFKDVRHRLNVIENNIDDIKKLGVNAVIFNPLFESERHGYDTIDFYKVDRRLGSNEDLKELIKKLHDNGIKVVLDGVFNHVGRKFVPFLDVIKNRERSPYASWFNINFQGNTNYNDGFWYEGWEGHYELVKLRLDNPEVQKYLMDAVRFWIDEFNIDGLRLDVCYLLPEWFMEMLRRTVNEKRNDFFLMGEIIHGTSYAHNICDAKLNSITNYECYKGMVSTFNTQNFFEIEFSLTRLFSNQNWALYTGKHLLNFLDNHDVPRVHTALNNKADLKSLYTLLFTIPGIPCIYYGSEYGIDGNKGDNDIHLRPYIYDIDKTKNTDLYNHIALLSDIKTHHVALNYGSYNKVVLQNKYMAFCRECDGEKIICVFNISDDTVTINCGFGDATDLLTGEKLNLSDVHLKAHTSKVIINR